ncbi:MAG TPA: hypothetical protein V6D47_11745 [Oscillatoriaceae cyanobacterium]
MADKKLTRTLAAQVLVAMAVAASLSACGNHIQPLGADTSASSAGDSSGGALPSAPLAPADDAGSDPEPDAPSSDTVAGPVNLPSIPAAPSTPVAPAQMQVHALAITNTIPALGMGWPIIRAKLSWTPVKGAVSYNIFQGTPNDNNQVQGKGTQLKGQLVFAKMPWKSFAFIGGGMGLTNLKVQQEYDFTVDALDRAGNVIAEGQDNCAPLPPLQIPYLTGPAQNAQHVGQTPYLSWTPSQGADGYYVEVFGTIKNIIPAMPTWVGFRSDTSAMNMLYGTQQDVMTGTAPIQWGLPLNIGSRYAWTVSAVRTDTHDWNNMKALAQATAPLNYFQP